MVQSVGVLKLVLNRSKMLQQGVSIPLFDIFSILMQYSSPLLSDMVILCGYALSSRDEYWYEYISETDQFKWYIKI